MGEVVVDGGLNWLYINFQIDDTIGLMTRIWGRAAKLYHNPWIWFLCVNCSFNECPFLFRLKYIIDISTAFILVCRRLHTSQGCFCPRTFLGNIELNLLPWNYLLSGLHSQLGELQGCFRLCELLALRCLLSWMNHLPPVSRSNFGKYIQSKFNGMENIFLLHLHIYW